MGYQLNLPPRYVHQISHLSSRTALNESADKNPRTVHFREDANQTIRLPQLEEHDLWYNSWDYALFEKDWKENTNAETTMTRKKKRRLILGQRPTPPPLEHFLSFRGKCCENRRRLIQCLLEHQASCRDLGYLDPDGCCILSKAYSRNDRKFAWQAAAVNAYEVANFQNETVSVSFASLLIDYYSSSIQPHMNDPLSYLSKVLLCQCD